MSNSLKITTLAPSKAKQKSLVERAMAQLDDVAEMETALSAVTDSLAAFYQASSRAEALRILRAFDVETVRAQAALLREAAYGPTNPQPLRLMLALLIDAIPAAKSLDAGTFLDAAVSTIVAEPGTVLERPVADCGAIRKRRGGYTPAVIARAVRRIWRTSTFAPSIAEILEALNAERRSLQGSVERAEIWLKRRDEMEAHDALNARGAP